MYSPDDCLMISGLQHFRFCRRQWALIHIEQQWAENLRTVEGNLLHERAHNEHLRESRGDLLIVRGLRVQSLTLGLTGQCDVVEFRRDDTRGVTLSGKEGAWLPYPVEYKHGAAKQDGSDALQLCAQAMCLEEMLVCEIPSGALFYGETRRRFPVSFTQDNPIGFGRNGDLVANTPHRLFPPSRGGRTVGRQSSCCARSNSQSSHRWE